MEEVSLEANGVEDGLALEENGVEEQVAPEESVAAFVNAAKSFEA